MTGWMHPATAIRHAMEASAPAVLGLLVTACATVTATAPASRGVTQIRPDFRARVEQVFRFQNQVTSDLITRYELVAEPGVQPGADLLAAEDRMQENCRYLNEIVMMSIDGQEPGLVLKTRLLQTVDSCDRAAHRVANLMYGSGQAVVMKSAPLP